MIIGLMKVWMSTLNIRCMRFSDKTERSASIHHTAQFWKIRNCIPTKLKERHVQCFDQNRQKNFLTHSSGKWTDLAH